MPIIKTLVLVLFMTVCAIQDLISRTVDTGVFIAMGLTETLLIVFGIIEMRHLWGCLIGAAIFLLGILFRGNIGTGDGLYFIMSGAMLGIEKNTAFAFLTVFLCSAAALFMIIYEHKNIRKTLKIKLPMLTIAFPVGILLIVMEGV